MIATGIMSLMAVALGSLAMTVQMSNKFASGHGTATQHARIAMERMERAMEEAVTSEEFPGFAFFSDWVGTSEFPNTLVVWNPDGPAADPDGMPLFKELVIFCPDPAEPNRLLEITVPNDSRPAPSLSNTAQWRTELNAIKSSDASEKVMLTDLLRTAAATDGGADSLSAKGAVRFNVVVRPSASQWADLKAGPLAWDNIPWAQSIHGSQTGLRQAWCRIELQLMPGADAAEDDPAGETAIPYFGSAAVYYELHRP